MKTVKMRVEHPADFVRFYIDHGKGRGSYVVRHPSVSVKSFTFKLKGSCANTQLHSFRTALQYAASALYENQELDVTVWRYARLYEPLRPALPEDYWIRSNPMARPFFLPLEY